MHCEKKTKKLQNFSEACKEIQISALYIFVYVYCIEDNYVTSFCVTNTSDQK